jgi:hypothetical protein
MAVARANDDVFRSIGDKAWAMVAAVSSEIATTVAK